MQARNRDLQIQQAVDGIYEAVVTPEIWSSALDRLDALFDAHSSHYFLWDGATNSRTASHRSRSFADNHPEWDYFHQINPRRKILLSLPLATPMNCADYIDDRAVARSEYFRDYSLPAGRRYLLGAYPYKESGVTSAFAVMRAPGKPAFSDDDSALLAYLMPHLSRAARIDRRMRAARKAEGTLSAALDNLTDALFVVDAKGRIVRANGRAVEMLETGDALRTRAGRLHTRQRSKEAQLSTLVASAASTQAVTPSERGGTVVLETPDGARCAVLIAPLMPSATLFDLADQRLVMIVASTLKAPTSIASRLAQAFSLTPAEARLADRVVAGATLHDIANEFNVRLTTLKTQLKSVFLKTGTRRQGQLMQLGAQLARLRELE